MRSRIATWFETKVRYSKTSQEDGTEKMVTESYVVDALNFTEAESKITDEIAVYVSGEYSVTGITKAAYSEVLFSDLADDDKWYKVKVQFVTLDDKTQKEKRTNHNYLVQSNSLARALRYTEDVLGKGAGDFSIVALSETKIMDVFEHKAPSDEKTDSSDEKKEEQNDVPEYEKVLA